MAFLLVLGLVVGEAGAELGVEAVGRSQLRRRAGGARGGDLDETGGHLQHAFAHPRLAFLPRGAAESVELNLCVLGAVARQQLQVLDGKVEFDVVGVVQLEAVVADAASLDRLQPGVASDTVVGVDDNVPCGERADLGEVVLRTFGVLALTHEPVAEDILLGDHGDVASLEALFQTEDGEAHLLAVIVHGLAERRDHLRVGDLVVGQDAGQALARAVRPCGENDVAAFLLQRADMLGGRCENVAGLVRPLGCEVAARAPAGVHHEPAALGMRTGHDLDRRLLFEPLQPLLFVEVEGARSQRLVVRVSRRGIVRALAGVVIILDLRQPLGRRLANAGIEHQRRIASVGEDRIERIVEQRQPMLEAGAATALADRLVEHVAPRLAAELARVVLAKTLDGGGGQLNLAHRHEVERFDLADRTLRLGIERSNRFQSVAEEVEADRLGERRRKQVENAAAYRVFAGVLHRGAAGEAVDLQPLDELVHVDGIARRGRERVLGYLG